jgi:hypothetical protein
MLLGEGLPAIMPGRAFTTAIPVELFIVPLGVAIAWLEFGRFLVLRRPPAPVAFPTPASLPHQGDEAEITGGPRKGPDPGQIQGMDIWLQPAPKDDRWT